MNGILNLLKPAGMTSHDCVAVIRRMAGQRKVGHTGTLDPNACGVLPLCLGQATRLIEYMDRSEKIYRCEALLGLQTDTQDIWGTVFKDERKSLPNVSEKEILNVLSHFMGQITQIPPAYSAVKVNGRRMYSYARAGVDVEAAARRITIHDLRLLRYDQRAGRILFEIRCSEGTYVRTICNDMGQMLGTGACMSFLLRTKSSGLDLETALTLEELAEMDVARFAEALLPPEAGLKGLRRLFLDHRRAELFLNGNKTFAAGLSEPVSAERDRDGIHAVYHKDQLLGVALYTPEKGYQVRKVLK
jgi:tRNA pseudouridine55 synthase